jgi:hypothetical protein
MSPVKLLSFTLVLCGTLASCAASDRTRRAAPDDGAASGSSMQPARINEDAARRGLERWGYRDIAGLHEIGNGMWIGEATYEGRRHAVEIDPFGHIVQQ